MVTGYDYPNLDSDFLFKTIRGLEVAIDDCDAHQDRDSAGDRARFLAKMQLLVGILQGRGIAARDLEERMIRKMPRPACKVFLCTEPAFDYRGRGDPEPRWYCEEHAADLGLSSLGKSFDDGIGVDTLQSIEAKYEARPDGPEVIPSAPFIPKSPASRPASTPEKQHAGALMAPTSNLHRLPQPVEHHAAGSEPQSGSNRHADHMPVLRPPDGDGRGLGTQGSSAGGGPNHKGALELPEHSADAKPSDPGTRPFGMTSQEKNKPQAKGTPMPKGLTPRKIKCLDDGKIFDSAADAAASVNRPASSIYLAIKKGIAVAGKRFAYADGGIPRKSPGARPSLRRPASAPPPAPPQVPSVPQSAAIAPRGDLPTTQSESMPGRLLAAITGAMLDAGTHSLQVDDFHFAVTAGGRRTEIGIKQVKFSVQEVAGDGV